jgi:hypothetical protein
MTQESITLNPEDDFESVLIDMVKMNRRKRADYAGEDDIIKNFRRNADLGWGDYNIFVDAYSMVTRKISRIQNLMSKGTEPQNESLADTLIDLAVYSVLLILCYEDWKRPFSRPVLLEAESTPGVADGS